MSFEQLNLYKEGPKHKHQSPYEILEDLRKLRKNYFKNESDAEKAKIKKNQHKLIEQLKKQAKEIIKKVENPATLEADRDKLMGQYGFIMDQMAINLPWSEMIQGNMQDIQNEALEKLQNI